MSADFFFVLLHAAFSCSAALDRWIDTNAALLLKAGALPTIALADMVREALPEGSTYADAAAWMHATSADEGAASLGCGRSS